MPVNTPGLYESLDRISYGLYVVTSCFEGTANGLIANTVIQVSSEPCRISVTLNKKSLTHELISKSRVYAVSVLDELAPLEFIRRFGYASGRTMDKLAGVAQKTGVTGCPLVIENSLSVFEANVFDTLDVGTHTVFAGEVAGAEMLRTGKPLTYAYYKEVKKGKAPKDAPTFRPSAKQEIDSTPKNASPDAAQYICDVCGYIYDPAQGDVKAGIAPGTPFARLPDTWVCPVCGVGKNRFSALT